MDSGPQPTQIPGPSRRAASRARVAEGRKRNAITRSRPAVSAGGPAPSVQYGSQRSGRFATGPLSYLCQLGSRLSQVEGGDGNTPPASTTLREDRASPESARGASGSMNSGPENPSPIIIHVQTPPSLVSASAASRSELPSTAAEDWIMPSLIEPQRPTYSFIDGCAAPMPILNDLIPIGNDWMDRYAHMYFQHIQPQWLFLNETAWRWSFLLWRAQDTQLDDCQKFIIRVVLAIGTLLCSLSQFDGPHLSHASSLHDGAI